MTFDAGTRYRYGQIKQKWRESGRVFISRNRQRLKEGASDWKVVCVPGEDGAEVLQVYLPLGVRPRNIIGIERGDKEYEHLSSLGLGIETFHGECSNFFSTCEQRFDIVSLDLESGLTANVHLIDILKDKQVLNNRSILITNFYGKREYLEKFKRTVIDNTTDDDERILLYLSTALEEDREKALSNLSKSLGYTDVRDLKSRGINHVIARSLMSGQDKLSDYTDEELAKVRNLFPFSFLSPEFRREDFEEAIRGFLRDNNLREDAHYLDFDPILTEKYLELWTDYARRMGYPELITLATFIGMHNYYFVEDSESYEYVNEGSPMFSDFFLLDQHRELFDRYLRLWKKLKEGIRAPEGIDIALEKRLRRDLTIIGDLEGKAGNYVPPTRIFLGSLQRRPRLTSQQYYQERIKAAEEGMLIEGLHKKLLETHRTDSKHLTAYETHVKMEIHGPHPNKIVKREVSIEKSRAPVEIKKPEKNFSQPDGKLEFSLRDLLPREHRHNSQYFSENQLLRMHYFINDLHGLLKPEEMQTILANIKESRWYASNKKKPTDTQIYAFFDDLTILARNKHTPDTSVINRVYHSVLNGNISSEVRKYIK